MAKSDNRSRLVVVLALVAVTIVAITTWVSYQKRASAAPTQPIYRAQHLNLF
jgi:hypothetical protein